MTGQDTDSSLNALRELLSQHRAGELAEYNVTANHVPMVLIALYRLGANSDRLYQYYAGIGIRAAPAAGSIQPPPIDTTRAKAFFERYFQFLQFFWWVAPYGWSCFIKL